MAVMVMDEFNTNSYNALCLTSSIIGIMGALYQVFIYLFYDIIKFKTQQDTILIIYSNVNWEWYAEKKSDGAWKSKQIVSLG